MTKPPKALPTAGNRPAAPAGRSGNPLGVMVKTKLTEDPVWGYFALNGKWICPFCLSPVSRRAGRSREDSLAVHLETCRAYAHGRGATQSSEIVARRQQYENLVHLADTDTSWRVYDATGTWHCPSCIERIPSVRLQNGQLNSFVYQGMAEHLSRCTSYLQGTLHPPETVQQARDRGSRLPALVQIVQNHLQSAVWRYIDPNGYWVCPCCLTHVASLRVTNELDWTRAPEGMASHLLSACPTYAQNPQACHTEDTVRQAAMETPQIKAASYRTPIPLTSASLKAGSNSVPAQRTPLPGRTPSSTGAPITRLQQQTAASRTPASPSPTQPAALPVEPLISRGTGGDSTPGGRRATATPPRNIQAQEHSDQTPVLSPPIAQPVAAPTPRANVAAQPQTSLFKNLNGDFLNETPLGELAANDTPPAAQTTNDDTNNNSSDQDQPTDPNDETQGLSWMDGLDGHEPHQHQLSSAERTDMIKARAVQQGMMQRSPELPGFRFATTFEACADISGDFYQFVRLNDGRIGFALGDVSGHGVQAGLIMSMAKKTFEIYASTGLGPADTLSRVNEALAKDLGGKLFISMVYALLDPTEHTITWARAGHNPTLHFSAKSGEVVEIKPPGMVVGMKSGPIFRQAMREEVVDVHKGDVFLLYTDGITETMNLQQDEFGPDRLTDVLKRFAADGPDHLVTRIMELIRHFRGPRPPTDDSTLLALVVD